MNELKLRCVAALAKMTTREVFEKIWVPEQGDRCSYESFKRQMRKWKHLPCADEEILACGTFPQFQPHRATVQVSASGKISQVWVKQEKETDWEEIRSFITRDAPRSVIEPRTFSGDTMLEIPLFDLHFGIADFAYYEETLSDLLGIICEKNFEEINILLGQDVLHTNDMRGHTAKGTDIQKIDFTQAWKDAWQFFRYVIDCSIRHASKVVVRYSKGNHDECSAWCLFKALEAVYPQVDFDDSLAPRKCIFWRGCFIGFGHCEYTSKNSLIFQNFVLDFPTEFAEAKVREIHSGHLHRESIDEGMMVRRLPSGVPTDDWSSANGYTGAHKRFQIFEWEPERLRAAYYV